MSVHNFASAIRAGASGSSASNFYDYQIANSARFDHGDSYMNRTQGDGNRKIYTFSVWILRGELHEEQNILSSYPSGADAIFFDSNNKLKIDTTGGGNNFTSNRVFEDTAKWYHIHIAYDTTQSTNTNRLLAYVNGEAITWSSSSFPSQDAASGAFNQNSANLELGRDDVGNDNYFHGLMAEFHFIDGTNYPYTTFGETKSGVWIPKDPGTLTYGTNGFYLKFDDAANLGNSTSPASVNFTVNNMSADHQDTNTPTFDAGG